MEKPKCYGKVVVFLIVSAAFFVSALPCNAVTVTAFYDDMEAGVSNWTAQSPWALVTSTSVSPTHCWHDSPSGNYNNNINISVALNRDISLTGLNGATLTFQTKYFTEGCCDRCYVEISTNGGSSWTSLNYFGGTQSSWTLKSYSLNDYIGSNVRIRFRLTADSSVTYDGWYIDDVRITGEQIQNLTVQPQENFNSAGDEGGNPDPFTPSSKIYTLSNVGASLLEWSAATVPDWLTATPTSGTLNPGSSTQVVISLNNTVNTLQPGTYNVSDAIIFTDITNNRTETRNASLEVQRVPGEIEVIDSIDPPGDMNMPFGNVITGLSQTGQVTVNNTDLNHTLVISDITLGKQYFEDFNDGQAQNWQPTVSSHWTVIGGEYRAEVGTSSTLMQSLYKGESWQDCSAKVRIRRTGYTSSASILVVRTTDDFNWNNTGTAYLLGIDAAGDYYFGKYVSGYFTFIQSWTYSPYLYTGTTANSVAVNIKGSKIDVDFNGQRAWSGTDISIGGTGRIGLLGYSGSFPRTSHYFDNVQVSELLSSTGTISAQQQWYNEHPYEGGSLEESPQDWTPPPYPGDGEILQPAPAAVIPFRLEHLPTLPATIPPGGNIVFDVNFAPPEFKKYQSTLVIKSDDRDEPHLEVMLSGTGIPDPMEILPDANFTFAGHPGGPFVPSSTSYSLTNNGDVSIDWMAESDVAWLNITPASGILASGGSVTVIVSPNSSTNAMPEGQHTANVIFTNLTTTLPHIRKVILNVYTDPKIRIQPASIVVSIFQGESETANLNIDNTGDGTLNYSISSRQTGFTPSPQQQSGSSAMNDVTVSAPEGHDFSIAADVPFAEDEIIVQFTAKTDGKYRDQKDKQQVLDSFGGGQIKRNFKFHPGLSVVKLPANLTVCDALKVFNGKRKEILYAEPDYQLTLLSKFPNDTYFTNLWGMHNTGQTGGTNDADIDSPEAWDLNTSSNDVIVAVIDTGTDYTHPDLAANMWVNTVEKNGSPGVDDDGNGYVDDIYGYDFYNKDGNPMDDHGHGTHVSGTIGAVGNNGQGVTGVCWNAKIMAVKFLNSGGSGYTSDAIDSIEYAAQMGAKIASNSWGGGSYSQSLKDTINAAGAAGMLFVAAAGNDYGNNNDTYPVYPASYDCANIIAVLSTDKYDAMSSFSNYGPTSVDLGAPGSNIYSCVPGNQYTYLSGTSMATPHVSGACALVWSVCPYLSSTAIKDIILQTTDAIPALNGRCVSNGRLNLANAVTKAGTAWITFDPPAGTVNGDDSLNVLVTFDAERPAGTYEGEIMVSSNDPFYPQVNIPVAMTVEPVDYLTELFDTNDPNQNDLAYRTLVFSPRANGHYVVCVNQTIDFPVDPAGGTVVTLRDDDYVPVTLQNASIVFCGINYDTFYIGSNGYITFESGDIRLLETLEDHFDLPRISALFDDLDPFAGGTISWKHLNDSVAVTFENISEYNSAGTNSFQVEMFFNGKIRITFLDIAAEDGLVGLSDGLGLSPYFTKTDFSSRASCNFPADFTGDLSADFFDFAIFAECEQAQYDNISRETVLDRFNTVSYSGNDGTQDWLGPWQESGEADGPAAGIMQIISKHNAGYLSFNPPNKGTQAVYGLVRDANLAGTLTAILTFDYETEDKTGELTALISPDGGTTWQRLATYDQSSGEGSVSFDIAQYAGASTLLKFELALGSEMYVHLDNIQIEYDLLRLEPPCVECNLDRQGLIDLSDLAIFADYWLE